MFDDRSTHEREWSDVKFIPHGKPPIPLGKATIEQARDDPSSGNGPEIADLSFSIRTRPGGVPRIPPGTEGMVTGDDPDHAEISYTISSVVVHISKLDMLACSADSLDGITSPSSISFSGGFDGPSTTNCHPT